MTTSFFRSGSKPLLLSIAAFVSGCSQEAPPPMAMPAPTVTVGLPTEKQVVDYVDFTGRMAPVESVKVRARVWGHLQKINFTEGVEVEKGKLLFVLDRRPYQAVLNRAEAEVAQSEARFKRLESDRDRAAALMQKRAISQEDFEKVAGEVSEVQAAVKSAMAAREIAKLNLDYTEVTSPIDGQVSKAWVTVGNLVESGELGGTVLTTVVSLDPIYVYFDVDDTTLLQIRSRLVERKKDPEKKLPVFLGLAHDVGFPHKGTIDFVDNQVDPGTGTLKMRGLFTNADRLLTPGMFVRVRLPLSEEHPALLLPDRAIDTDQGQKLVYVVNSEKVVEKRPVQLGRIHEGLREIKTGIQAGEQVVMEGLQRVRPGMTVEPKRIEK